MSPTVAQRGFTLLEMLVALVVLGLLVAGLAHGVRSGMAVWNAQTREIGKTADLDTSARLLRQILSEIPSLPDAGGANAAISIAGEAEQLTLIGDLPTGLGETRRAEITLRLNGGRLALFWRPYRHEQSSGPPPAMTETELIAGVEQLNFAYWATAGAQPAGWVDRWSGPTVPQLFKVHLGFGKADSRRWPDLIVAPRVASPTG